LPDKRGLRTDYLDYDRSLNDQARATSAAPVPPNDNETSQEPE
jgi:hypothetical protein